MSLLRLTCDYGCIVQRFFIFHSCHPPFIYGSQNYCRNYRFFIVFSPCSSSAQIRYFNYEIFYTIRIWLQYMQMWFLNTAHGDIPAVFNIVHMCRRFKFYKRKMWNAMNNSCSWHKCSFYYLNQVSTISELNTQSQKLHFGTQIDNGLCVWTI